MQIIIIEHREAVLVVSKDFSRINTVETSGNFWWYGTHTVAWNHENAESMPCNPMKMDASILHYDIILRARSDICPHLSIHLPYPTVYSPMSVVVSVLRVGTKTATVHDQLQAVHLITFILFNYWRVAASYRFRENLILLTDTTSPFHVSPLL